MAALSVHDEHGLSLVSDSHVVRFVEVPCDTDFLSILDVEVRVGWSMLELYVLYNVSSLCSIICNDRLPDEHLPDCVFEFSQTISSDIALELLVNDLVIDFMDGVQHRLSTHESIARVNDKRTTTLVFIGCALEPFPDLHLQLCDINRARGVKEPGSLSKLKKSCLAHSLLDDYVKHLTHCLTVLSVWVLDVTSVDDVLSFKIDFQSYFLTHQLGLDQIALIELLHRPDVETRIDVLANKHLYSIPLSVNYLADFKRSKLVRAVVGHLVGLISMEQVDGVLVDLGRVLANLHSKLVGEEVELLYLAFLWIAKCYDR